MFQRLVVGEIVEEVAVVLTENAGLLVEPESNLKRTSSGGPICLLSAGESGSRQDLAAGSSSA